MKKIHLLCLLLILSGALTQEAKGVNISPVGHGEALIFPYYTVRNDFNAAYSIVNTSAQAKALKIRFHSGDQGSLVLGFNVYLAPFDVWTGVLIPTTSTIPQHIGEPSVSHLSNDQSCAPFLNKAGQEFLPFAMPPGDSLELATEGYLEVIEMGQLTGPSLAAVVHQGDGTPASCSTLTDAWDTNGYWQLDPSVDMTDPDGGLIGSMNLINVAEGLSVGYEALALDAFWQSAGLHTEPANIFPNLENAAPQSILNTDQGLLTLDWLTGYQAVSAALMSHSVTNEFDLIQELSARTEWVLNFPTKRHHTDSEFSLPQPFAGFGDDICEQASVEVFDQRTRSLPHSAVSMCSTVAVIEFIRGDETPGQTTAILDSFQSDAVTTFTDSTSSSGWARLTANGGTQALTSASGKVLVGLPVAGFKINQFTNTNSAPGLLAQYSSMTSHAYQRVMLDDLIFANGLD